MADVIKSIRQYMLGKSAITAIVGQRIYQGRLPQGQTSTSAVLHISSETYEHGVAGLTGIINSRIQVECYSSTAEAARSLADEIMWCGIDQIKGTYTSTDIRGVAVEDGRREYEDDDTSGGDDQRHVVTFDLMVTHLRAS